jgi:Putative prokaryotic signal transducing protein
VRRLYQARDRIEAQFLVDVLAGQRIRAAILGDYLSGAAGGLPLDICPTVCVIDDRDLARARSVVDDFLATDPPSPPWTCSACGELVEPGFQLCWRCGRPRSV